jgi:hypothetical protein
LLSPDTLIKLATNLKQEQEARQAAELERVKLEVINIQIEEKCESLSHENSQLACENEQLLPDAQLGREARAGKRPGWRK